ncbi:flagellar basal body P-ring formation protein FlgA [Sphingomonas changnyeongensis]|uniref:Flagella basal body P-ring formation protein FlgA n=1 Tax=Sphingomonas changnyeongensis TaxID=2698679 RepID=A0A7Z2S9F5_9SPHN|nr:flagellar basal body P-ring formation chaperone FlgA [Sphingomonas changnyeongensis]QHL91722.1 flagellar basal body P-ring formation protein FlgA [Sphingomonas changnyeongensis]
MLGLALLLAGMAGAAPGVVPPAAPLASAFVLARPVERGEIIATTDFVAQDVPASQTTGALAANAAAGMEATRRLNAGAVVRSGDVMAPRLVRRGEPVTLRVRSGALTITAQGRALSDGRRGDVVRVVAPSNKTLEGAVDGPASVRIAAN